MSVIDRLLKVAVSRDFCYMLKCIGAIRSVLTDKQFTNVIFLLLSLHDDETSFEAYECIFKQTFSNQKRLYEMQQAVGGFGKPVSSSLLQRFCSRISFHKFPTDVQELDVWSIWWVGGCSLSDEFASVGMSATQQISGTCFCFAAVRSFNHR